MKQKAICFILLLFLLPENGIGSTAIGFYKDSVNFEQVFEDSGGIVQLRIFITESPGLIQVSFSAPTPDCMSGAILLGETYSGVSSGSIESGVTVDFGGCRSGFIDVGTLSFFPTGVDSCCPYGIIRHPSSITIDVEALDCDSNEVVIIGLTSTIMPGGFTGCGVPTTPTNPEPEDTSNEQPRNPILNWDTEPTTGTGICVFVNNLYLGTGSDPPLYWGDVVPPLQVGPLIPNTKYYWKITSGLCPYGSVIGPIWSFTTGAGISATEITTWGAIKALYR